MVAALGIAAGLLVHIIAAAIGVSAVIVASAAAFAVLKWIGTLYLIYLGIQMLRSSFQTDKSPEQPQSHSPIDLRPPIDLRHVFAQGLLTNVLNAKIALFFLAFLPQFVDTDAPSKAVAFMSLGLLFNIVGTAWNFGVAWFAGALTSSKRYARIRVWLERGIGVLFVGVGVRLALAERP